MSWVLNKQILELRFKDAYIIWDRAGQIAKGLLDKHPTLEVEEANPSRVVFISPSTGMTLRVSHDAISLVGEMEYSSLTRFYEFAQTAVPALLKTLEIHTLLRIGNRIIYDHPADSIQQARKMLVTMATSQHLGATFLEHTDDQRLTGKSVEEILLRFSDEKIGLTMSIKPQQRLFEVKGPGSKRLMKLMPPAEVVLSADFDIYTLQPAPVTLLIVEELLKSNAKMVETRILSRLALPKNYT